MPKVLFIASNFGLWGEELQAPWDACRAAGFECQLATYKGLPPLPLVPSVTGGTMDPIRNILVTPEDVADRVKEIINKGEWNNPIKITDADMNDYDSLVIVGGQGAFFDVVGNMNVHDLITKAYQSEKLVAALCSAVNALSLVRNPKNQSQSIMKGKKSAAYPREWLVSIDVNYKLFGETEENHGPGISTPGFIFPGINVIEDATGDPKLVFTNPKADRDNPLVIYDDPFLTAQSIESAATFGEMIVLYTKQKSKAMV